MNLPEPTPTVPWEQQHAAGLHPLANAREIKMAEWSTLIDTVVNQYPGFRKRTFRFYNEDDKECYSAFTQPLIYENETFWWWKKHIRFSILDNQEECVLVFARERKRFHLCGTGISSSEIQIESPNLDVIGRVSAEKSCLICLTQYIVLDKDKQVVLEIRPCFKWLGWIGMPADYDVFTPGSDVSIGRMEATWDSCIGLSTINIDISFPQEMALAHKAGVLGAAMLAYM